MVELSRTDECSCPRCNNPARYWWRRSKGRKFAQFIVYCESCFGQMRADEPEMPKKYGRRIAMLQPIEPAKPSMFATTLSLPNGRSE